MTYNIWRNPSTNLSSTRDDNKASWKAEKYGISLNLKSKTSEIMADNSLIFTRDSNYLNNLSLSRIDLRDSALNLQKIIDKTNLNQWLFEVAEYHSPEFKPLELYYLRNVYDGTILKESVKPNFEVKLDHADFLLKVFEAHDRIENSELLTAGVTDNFFQFWLEIPVTLELGLFELSILIWHNIERADPIYRLVAREPSSKVILHVESYATLVDDESTVNYFINGLTLKLASLRDMVMGQNVLVFPPNLTQKYNVGNNLNYLDYYKSICAQLNGNGRTKSKFIFDYFINFNEERKTILNTLLTYESPESIVDAAIDQ